MEYQGLTRDDLDNVRALNAAWLQLHGATSGERLTERRRQRLAAVPFLLFSLREHDDEWWQRRLDDGRQQDLLARASGAGDELRSLQATALAFLWELSRRNPYVARVVGGFPLHWCERIATVTLLDLLTSIARCDVIEPRFDAASPVFRNLLERSGSKRREARHAARIAALQAMLSQADTARYAQLPAAACRMKAPVRKVADEL